MNRWIIFLAPFCLSGCGGEGADPAVEQAKTAQEAAFAGEPQLIAGNGQYSVLLGNGATPETMEVAARGFCAGEQWCQVMGWRDAANRPTAMPMLPRESEAVAFSYLINRSSGTEQVLWDCRVWPGDPAQCLAGGDDVQ